MKNGLFALSFFALSMSIVTPSASFAQVAACSTFTAACLCRTPCQWLAGVSQCVPPAETAHACDDGTVSGVASVVSSVVSGAAAADKFKSVVNKKLACCLNSFTDPASVKYDCVDNSTDAFASFDDLWKSTDSPSSGGQTNGLVLGQGGDGHSPGKPITGFYTLGGARCTEYSEFGGTLHGAKVNPGIVSKQQDKLASADPNSEECEILPGAYTVVPSVTLSAAMVAAGRGLPYDGHSTHDCAQAAHMRRCPVLVRAAMVATCPRNGVAPILQNSYKDGANHVHCTAAASVNIHIRVEQIYEILGSPLLPTVDTILNSINVNSISLSSIILSKIGTSCPANMSSHSNTCMECPAGCGGQGCSQCPANTYSTTGSITCTACPAGTTSPAGSTDPASCTP